MSSPDRYWKRLQATITVITRFEKRIAECDGLNALHIHISDKVRVYEEEDGHIDSLSCRKPLLFKAEALDLGEVRRHLPGRYTVCGDADYILIRPIRRREEGERCLAWMHSDFTLLGGEFPRKSVRYGGGEGDAQPGRSGDGLQTLS